MAYRGTKRPQNRCKTCGYTWYPRGKSLSPKCPNCGSGETRIVGPGLVGGLIALGIIAAILGHSNTDHSPTQTSLGTPVQAASNVTAEAPADSTTEPTHLASATVAVETPVDDGTSPAASSADSGTARAEVPSLESASTPRVTQEGLTVDSSGGGIRKTYRTSFDCASAAHPDEIAVCGDPGLAAMDIELAADYSNYLHRLTDRQPLIQSQQKWLRERGTCGADLDCLRRSYGARIGQMRDMQQRMVE